MCNRDATLLWSYLNPFINWNREVLKLGQKTILTSTRNCTDNFISLGFNQLLHMAVELCLLRFFVIDLPFQLSIFMDFTELVVGIDPGYLIY